jgi:hypothetical protein
MSTPIGYNVPEGVDAQAFLSDELIVMLGESFAGVTDAFGDDATLYKIDIGKIIDSVQAGGLIISGQFVDQSDGEIFNFEINQDSNQLRYRSAGEFLNEERLAVIRGESSADEAEGINASELKKRGQQLYDLLYDAVNDRDSEAGQSPFGIKLSKDLDYLAALSAAMYHAGITIEVQPLYAGLHSYAIKYTLAGLRLFSDVIGAMEGPEAEALANRWIDENGLGFAASFVKAFSSQRCESMREQIHSENQTAIEDIKAVLEEGLGMAMACTTDLIRSIAEAEDYEEGDVQVTLAAAIEDYCPIDNSDGYHVSINPRRLSTEWQEVVQQSGCVEDLSMQALGLPPVKTAASEPASSITGQAQSVEEGLAGDDEMTDGARMFYVNVGEGPSRNWDDCRQFGFLAAGGGRKWSKQLEKIKTGDTVIAYLKGYGYVGIGKVVTASTPATKFMVNGVRIRELPLVNDTIRSIKRFSKENGEYLIGVDWQSAVPREQAAWQANAGLYTTALVCASLRNQAATVSFAFASLLPTQASIPSAKPSQDHDNESSWNDFMISLVAFLQSNTDEIENDAMRAEAAKLYALCPSDLSTLEQAKSIQSLMTEDINNKLIKVCMRLIEVGDEALALFFIGICELGDMTDEVLERFLDLVDEGMNLSTLATEYVPHNVFEINALMSLIYWPEMPDWSRAHLATRTSTGLTSHDRDSFIEYLGSMDILGAETLLAICGDIAAAPDKYSVSFIKALKAFLVSDFEAVSTYNSDPDALTSHLDYLGDYCIVECRKRLGLVEDSEDAKELCSEEQTVDPIHSLPEEMTCASALKILEAVSSGSDSTLNEAGFESLLDKVINQNWKSEEEYALFFVSASMSMYQDLVNGEVSLFGHEVSYSFYPGTTVWDLWTKARKLFDVVETVADQSECITDAMRESLNITSIFNIFPAALNASYDRQSLGEWLAHGIDNFSYEDNEFFCTFLALAFDNDAALLDIACNLRSTPVLDELVFYHPELLLSNELLLEGYGSNGLLGNRSLSENSLVYLSALLLGVPLPANYAGKTVGDLSSFSASQLDVTIFRDENIESIAELNLASIADVIGRHPNCTVTLADKLIKP